MFIEQFREYKYKNSFLIRRICFHYDKLFFYLGFIIFFSFQKQLLSNWQLFQL